ncbi:MAG TPA: low temperature requirement protein A, partial [Acidimicrobiia bacterium]|nr:low temperature requirement protein A [Acidimicrobiia bacterium]
MSVDGYHELPPEQRRVRRLSAELRERESVMPLELFFDLVFVLAFTQCTALMEHESTWSGLGKGILALAVIWWAWVCYAWLTSVVEPEQGAARIVLLLAMAGMLVIALCVPEAFGDRALLFAIAYGLVRAGHIGLFVKVSRDVPEMRRTVLTFACSTALAIALLVVASFTDGTVQAGLWIASLSVDCLGASFRVDGWSLVPRHFAERHNLVIILALGESIVALGIGAQVDLDAAVITAAVLGVGLAAALWWIYFDVVALVTERRLIRAAPGPERNRLARDSYSFLHFPMVAGIVLSAFGLHEVLV